jgi:PmbA protein
MTLLELCKRAVDSALQAGAKEAEALIISTQSTGVEIERAQIKTCANLKDVGVAVRAVTDGRTGFAYTNMPTEQGVDRTAKRAAKASKASLKDENWRRFPETGNYPSVEDSYDKRITEYTPEQVVSICQQMMAAAVKVDKKVLPALGGAEVATQEIGCTNSNGVEVIDNGTSLSYALGAIARSETEVSPVCVEFKASRTLSLQSDWVGEEAAKMALDSINVGKAEAGSFPVLLDPFALQSLLTFTLIPSIKGDAIFRGRSILKDKIGEKIAGENVTVHDDGTLPGGLHSGRTDLEGGPRRKTPLIEDGVLQGFLYDNYWARLQEKESTGNAGRSGGGLQLPTYGTLPTIQPSNVTLGTGTATDEELRAEVRSGYYVRNVQGAHQSNPETGDFSVALAPAWRILKGEISHAVKGVMISGNIYKLIKNVTALGKEARALNMLIAPKVVVADLKVVSR